MLPAYAFVLVTDIIPSCDAFAFHEDTDNEVCNVGGAIKHPEVS